MNSAFLSSALAGVRLSFSERSDSIALAGSSLSKNPGSAFADFPASASTSIPSAAIFLFIFFCLRPSYVPRR